MKLLYEKLVEELAKRNLKCKIIAVGRSALELYRVVSKDLYDTFAGSMLLQVLSLLFSRLSF